MSVWIYAGVILFLQTLYQIKGFELVRLTNFESQAGSYTVEVNYNRKWLTMCGPHWYPANARVVCRQTGQPSTRCVAEFRSSKDLPEESKSITLNYQCMGNETALHRCPYQFDQNAFERNCGRQPRFAVICGLQCPAWRYGNDCLPCYCNRNNTEKCDGVTGNCTCKAGFFGETCDCQTGKHTCDSKTSFCHLNNGKPVCLCKRGISPTPKNNCKDFGLRFIERSAKDRGEVEFYSNGTWNALCILSSRPSEINYNVLNVICRQLGLPEVHIGTYFSKYIPKTNLPDYEIAEASCEGTETSLQACNITVAPALKCNIAVGIQCLAACPEWRYGTGCTFCSCNRTNSDSCDPTTGACKCKSGYSGATCDCLQGNNPCNDTVSECHAQSGKPLCLCKTKFVGRNNYNCTDPIRLANLSTTVTSSGKKLYAGRVELYVNGSWGTVCDDSAYPRSKMTKVMCRNLGLPSIYTDFRKEAYYGQGSGPIHYGYIQCGGTEDTVSQCYTSTTAYCGHHEDLGIICGEECPAFTFGRDCINCQCLQSNTLYCNKTSGECKCKDGFEGQTCSCRKGNHTCELTTSICEKGACYCKYGIKPTSSCIERLRLDKANNRSLQYHKNNKWNYICMGDLASAFASDRVICQVMNLPTRITSLKVAYTAQKGYKFKIDDRCMTALPYPRAECLKFEDSSSFCDTGIVQLQCLTECPDWTYFTKNECHGCPCNVTNTERCDKRSGKCVCKPGYVGDLCNCKGNTCNIDVAFCQDNENGTSCLCKPGYENRGFKCQDSLRLTLRLTLTKNLTLSFKSVEYRINNSWIYGLGTRNSSPPYYDVCERLGLPTFYNKLSSYPVPLDTQFVDSMCMRDEYSRLSLNYTKCAIEDDDIYDYFSPQSLAETATCLSDCPSMMFFNATSSDCVLCNCNNNTTDSCNQTTGECTCKTGFYGPSCDCIKNQHNCNNTYSYCSFHGTTPVCNCRVGFYGRNLGCFESLRFIRDTGVLQLYHQDQWMLIGFSYRWDENESKVICTQLGLPTFYMSCTSKYRSQTGLMYSDYSNRKRITYLSCTGDEMEVSQCRFSVYSYISSYSLFGIVECRSDCPDFMYGSTCKRCNCNQQYSISCNKTTGECNCKSGYYGDTCDCVEGSHACNATIAFCGDPTPTCYCRDHYNRRGLNCTDSIRFYGKVNSSEGVLQINHNRSWKTFCKREFTKYDARVACRHLNLPNRYIQFGSTTDAKGIQNPSGIGTVDTLECNGNETSLFECEDFSTHESRCSIYGDVYLQCFSECPKWTHGDFCEKRCDCNKANSLSCDEDTGICNCKTGYFGDFCNCITGVHTCNSKISICHTNSSGNAICLCKVGFSESEYKNEKCRKEQVRLINRTSSNEGVVEIYRSGSWGGVCKNRMTKKDVQVVCREFGLPSNSAQLVRNFILVPSSYFKWPYINCNGTEQSLLDCEREYDNSTSCFLEGPATIACPNEPWIRMVAKQTTYRGTSGTPQIYRYNKWGYICDIGFDKDDAKVACRELGLPTKYVRVASGIFRRSTRIHLINVICNGDEETLSDCYEKYTYHYFCHGYIVVWISCDSECPYMKYGDNCEENCKCNRQNTASCDMETGECVCKPGYTGFSCNCKAGSHTCNTTYSDCFEESSGIYCICKKGFSSLEYNCTDKEKIRESTAYEASNSVQYGDAIINHNVRLGPENTVQVFEGDAWGGICESNLKNNARVICRHLNLSTEVVHSTSKSNRYGKTMKSVSCIGTEEMLSECPSRMDSCYYSTVVVHCGECPEWRYSEDCSKSCDCNKGTSLGCDFRNGTCSCRDGFKGEDCSCHNSIAPCSGSFSKCKHNKCICEEGSFNQSASCSDFSDVIYFCSFEKYLWKNTCSMETSNSRFYRNTGVSIFSWKPSTGTDDIYYLFMDSKPYYLSADNYFAELNITLNIKRKQFCFYFDYFLYGRGSIRISTIDISHLESTVADLSGSQQKWTTKDTQINGKKLIHKIKIRMEERTAIDRIIVAGSRCVCSNWTFGQNCDKCACVRMHTQSCDKTTGACLCKKGFTGDACQCEANGKPCLRGVRLVNGNTTNMGRVEVVTEGIWSTVCDGNWDDNDATVVCKQLGLGNSGIAMKNAAFGKGVGPIHVDKFACKGDENDLLKCSFTRSSCDHSDDAGVVCVNQSNIIRLRDGTDRTNGRLEIKLDESGSWGRVCSQRFGESDARVACRQLGLPTRSVEAKTYAPGSGTILLTRLGCNGDEDAIQLCYGIRNPSSCRYYDDAGISCSNDCPSFTYGKECEDDCNCDRSNSLSCDKDTGECMCKSGWSGTRCTCERRIKCDENSYCDGFKCLCNDGFFRKPTNCSDVTDVLYSCSFETDFETCSIKNYGLMQWTKHYNGTPSYNTGPYRAKEGIYYVYTEASSQSTGNKGVMKIPVSNLNFTTYACFQFYFHMGGDNIGDLKITVQDAYGSKVTRWSKSGHYGYRWEKGYLPLPSTAAEIKITGIRGKDYRSDIALDDFKITHGHCGCEKWKYGLTCEKSCDCIRGTSEGCNSQTGSCVCQSGWSGKTCNCRRSKDTCHPTYSYCHGDFCLCKDGVYANGVNCSGSNDITYFCAFDLADSVNRCKIKLPPMLWEIEEDRTHSISDIYHPTNNRYLQTRLIPESTMYSFTLKNISLKSDSCLRVKYFTRDPTKQMLRIQVIKDEQLMSNRLFQGGDWSTASVSVGASSRIKIHFIVYVYNNLPVLIDDIAITAKKCGACSQWYYGSDCEKMSKCNRTNTLSYGHQDQCNCSSNWFGEKCDCFKSENDACLKQGEVCMGGRCLCRDGYTRVGIGCRDIDECKFLCKSSLQTCKNTNGSYSCTCNRGSFGDGTICSESPLAITNGSTPMNGTILMWRDNIWGAVCQPFDLFTAMLACNTLFGDDIHGVHLAQQGGYKSPNGVAYKSFVCDKKSKRFDLTKCNVSIEPCDTEKDAVQLSCGVCGGVYKSQFGLVEPPLQVPANTLCFYLLKPFNSKTINATFISFSLNSIDQFRRRRSSSLIPCDDTYIEIFDGPDANAPFIGRYCGSRPRFTVTSTRNSLLFIYKTSRNTSKHDFQIIYETEKSVEDPHALGERCSHSVQCVANNASCIRNICTCDKDYYMFDSATCLERKSLNSSCSVNEQCKTSYCHAKNQVCYCPLYSEIDEVNEVCVAIRAKSQQEQQQQWLVPVLLLIIIIIIILIAAIVIFAKKKGYILRGTGNDATFTYSELMAASNSEFNTGDKISHRCSVISISQAGEGNHRIRLSTFGDTFESLCDYVNWPEEEFRSILRSCEERPTDIGTASQNRHKNRNRDVLPYDYNRLRESGVTSVDDYINASVIEGLHSHYPYYIVTQYPLISTQNDFWGMVWEQRVTSIISLVSGSEKEVYFPTRTGMTRSFGKIKVQTLSTLTVHRCTFRCLKIVKGSKSHTVNHFQSSFLSNFTRDECSDLLNLINLVHSNSEDGNDSRPLVIHCLNGTGKSGVFVAMDYLIQLIRNGDTHVDIYNLTHVLISNREKLIENETQYQFLYDCVEFYLDHEKKSPPPKISEAYPTEEEDIGLIELSHTKTTFFAKKY